MLETNFRLYAYTDSPVWAQVLQIFAQLQYLLPNMIVGDLTRDSLLAAAQRGVTAVDIAEFLERNAHPRMLARVSASAIAAVAGGASLSEPSMPENVLNLMEIWSKEKHRPSELHGPAPVEPLPQPSLKKNLIRVFAATTRCTCTPSSQPRRPATCSSTPRIRNTVWHREEAGAGPLQAVCEGGRAHGDEEVHQAEEGATSGGSMAH